MATILVVDDTPANLALLTDLLTAQGYRVRSALNGALALSAIRTTPPDLILLDILMPGMDGYEVCRRLKADEQTRDIPIIFISALDAPDNVITAFEVGGADYVTKPFKAREVLVRVESQLAMLRQRRQVEEQHRRDIQYYETLDKLKQHFIRSATHDLKNPLSLIWGYAGLLEELDGPGFEQHGRGYVKIIQNSAARMHRLITDMLELAQLETGVTLSIQAVPLMLFWEAARQNFELPARQKSIDLKFSPPPDDVIVQVDPNHIARAIDNLLSNAVKFTPEGGHVELTAQVNTDCVVIQVIDDGIGIPEKDLPHIFDAFYRVEHPEGTKTEGTGLGLSIVKSIVEQHRGQIQVESQAGKGTTLSFSLPYERQHPAGSSRS